MLEDIELRVRRIERENRMWRGSAIATAFLACVFLGLGAAPPNAKKTDLVKFGTILAEGIVIGGPGKSSIALNATDKVASFRMQNAAGDDCAFIAITEHNDVMFELKSPGGARFAATTVDKKLGGLQEGDVRVRMTPGSGEEATVDLLARNTPHRSGLIHISGSGKRFVALGVSGDNAIKELGD